MNPRKIAVTLVCASDDEPLLEPVLDRLRDADFEAELVSGVDRQPRRVGEALDRCGEWGVIVACVSKRLDGPELRKVEGVFSARRGPNHAIIRVDVSQAAQEMTTTITRAVEAFAANQGRIVRRPITESRRLREIIPVNDISSLAMPVVRLEPHEEIDGDTSRIQLPDNPKSAELSRRRRVARERERERERTGERSAERNTRGHFADDNDDEPAHDEAPPVKPPTTLDEDAAKLDRMMVVMIVGAGVLAVLAALTLSGCASSGPVVQPHDTISIVSPRCAGVRSCVVGHVTAAGTAAPVAEAAVFLEREPERGEDEPIRILALTDEQGVFVVDDPPPGSYRLAVYKDDSSVEVAGLELGRDGTTVLPVRLAIE
jgi:hypothetical protein